MYVYDEPKVGPVKIMLPKQSIQHGVCSRLSMFSMVGLRAEGPKSTFGGCEFGVHIAAAGYLVVW